MEVVAEEDPRFGEEPIQEGLTTLTICLRRDRLVLDGDRAIVGVECLGRGAEDRHVAVEEQRGIVIRGRDVAMLCRELDQLRDAIAIDDRRVDSRICRESSAARPLR